MTISREFMVKALTYTIEAVEANKQMAALGLSVREVAAHHAQGVRDAAEATGDYRMIHMADLLEAGEFDQELACILGYV